MLKLWGTQGNLSLPSLPDTLWLGVVAHGKVLLIGKIELFDI